MAVLSIEAADVQVDCLHRLIAGLCAANGGVELLCRLPWAHNLLVRVARHCFMSFVGSQWLQVAGKSVGCPGTQPAGEAELACLANQHGWRPPPMDPTACRGATFKGCCTACCDSHTMCATCLAAQMQLVKGGRQTWVPMLEEVRFC